jgi:glycosyltransferase involved in cell wall biosynthesis
MLGVTIVSVAFPLLPVSSGSAGGAEQILFLLDQEFVRRGHRSIVIAAKGSRISGQLVETPVAEREITDPLRGTAHRAHMEAIDAAIRQYKPDLLHFHGLDFPEYLPAATIPRVATLHMPLDWYQPSAFTVPDLHLVCVSQSQFDSRPQLHAHPVANGIDLSRYHSPPEASRKNMLWMGRICREKGVHLALQAAQRGHRPLIVAGPVHPFPEHQAYFTDEVKPLLDSERRFVGAVNSAQKADLLGEATCVLIPSLAAETSSLVAMEAAASGTPVIAYRSGALPEIVEDGTTGFVVDSQEEMIDACARLESISSARCRRVAESRFDSRRMAGDYLALYAAICDRESPRSVIPGLVS